jgi:hypothetical protein
MSNHGQLALAMLSNQGTQYEVKVPSRTTVDVLIRKIERGHNVSLSGVLIPSVLQGKGHEGKYQDGDIVLTLEATAEDIARMRCPRTTAKLMVELAVLALSKRLERNRRRSAKTG